MTLDEIKGLIDAMGSSDLSEMAVERNGWSLRLVRHAAPAPTSGSIPSRIPRSPTRPASQPRAAEAPKAPARGEVCAPLAGIVYFSPTPGAPSFVGVGQPVLAGAVLCVVEAMKTFNEVRAERDGTVEAILVASGSEVDAGATLMRIA